MDFRLLDIDDRFIMESVFRQLEYVEQEYSFPFHWLWREFNNTMICIQDDIIVLRFSLSDEGIIYFPICKEINLQKSVEIMERDACGRYPIVMSYVNGKVAHCYESFCEFKQLDSYYDYVYKIEDFANPQGGLNKHKREWIHHFQREYPNYRLEIITDQHKEDCFEILYQWQQIKHNDKKYVYEPELPIVKEALEMHAKLGLKGHILKVDDTPVAFMFNYAVATTWLHCIIAKADIRFQGATRMLEYLVYQFYEQQGYQYVNFGDDNNSLSLRNMKERLNPIEKLYKYEVRLNKCI